MAACSNSRSKSAWLPGLALLVGLSAGCAETTVIKTSPAGGRVSINGQSVGTAPVEYSVPRWDFHEPYRYRVELGGYVSKEGVLNVHPPAARVIGIVLTYGVLALFKRPSTFDDEVDIRLEPSGCTTEQEAAIRKAGLGQSNVDVVCVRGYGGAPRVTAPVGCRAEQILAMKASGLTEEQARRACGE